MATQSVATEEVTMPLEVTGWIRQALMIGLACYGLYVELDNACENAKACGHPWPEEACPIDPTGQADTVSKFADAIRTLDMYERAALRTHA